MTAIANVAANTLTPQNALTKNTAVLTISHGDTDSNAIDLNGNTLSGFFTPAALTGSTLTIKVSMDGTNFGPLTKDDNTTYSITVAANKPYSPNLALLKGWRWVMFSMNTAELPGANLTRVFPITYTGV